MKYDIIRAMYYVFLFKSFPQNSSNLYILSLKSSMAFIFGGCYIWDVLNPWLENDYKDVGLDTILIVTNNNNIIHIYHKINTLNSLQIMPNCWTTMLNHPNHTRGDCLWETRKVARKNCLLAIIVATSPSPCPESAKPNTLPTLLVQILTNTLTHERRLNRGLSNERWFK